MSKYPRGVYVDFRRTPEGGWRGEMRFQLTDGHNMFRVAGDDDGTPGGAAHALSRAVAMADRLTSDPMVAQLLPPGTKLAIATVKSLAKAAHRGILGREIDGKPLYKHFTGAFGKLARALHGAEQKKQSTLAGGPLLLADRRAGDIGGCP